MGNGVAKSRGALPYSALGSPSASQPSAACGGSSSETGTDSAASTHIRHGANRVKRYSTPRCHRQGELANTISSGSFYSPQRNRSSSPSFSGAQELPATGACGGETPISSLHVREKSPSQRRLCGNNPQRIADNGSLTSAPDAPWSAETYHASPSTMQEGHPKSKPIRLHHNESATSANNDGFSGGTVNSNGSAPGSLGSGTNTQNVSERRGLRKKSSQLRVQIPGGKQWDSDPLATQDLDAGGEGGVVLSNSTASENGNMDEGMSTHSDFSGPSIARRPRTNSLRRLRSSTREVALQGETPMDDFDLASASSLGRGSLAGSLSSMHRYGNDSISNMDDIVEIDSGELLARDTETVIFVSLRRPSYMNRVVCCPSCKAEVAAEGARFCHQCGHGLGGKMSFATVEHEGSTLGTPSSCASGNTARAYHRKVKITRNGKSLLGKGASGTVYQAIDVMSGQPLAVKELEVDLGDTYELQSIRKELRNLSSLRHMNIVEYMGCQVESISAGSVRVSILMERLGCGSLSDLLKQMPDGVPETAAKSFAQQLLDAISYVHDRGVTHRDLKPSNLLLAADGTIKISDFGSALVAAAGEHTNDGRICGTPAYMPPESVDLIGKQNVDWLSHGMAHDIWSIGCCLHEFLTGEVPWAWTGLQPFALLQEIKKTPFPISTRLSPLAREFLGFCLEHDWEQRKSAAALLTHPYLEDRMEGSWMSCDHFESTADNVKHAMETQD